MEYMDQVVGNILIILLKGFQKRSLKTDLTFRKKGVALVFFCCRHVNGGKDLGTRVEMFSICTSVEFDLKQFILGINSNIKFTEEMLMKAKERKKDIESDEEILNQLDLSDFANLISDTPYDYKINIINECQQC